VYACLLCTNLSSPVHCYLSCPLQELHISYIEQEHLIGTAGASVDILVVVNNVRVALEVDGPSHYSTNKLDG
jgi:hypothetical protein